MPDQTKYTNKLTDSRILVIGGSSGIGYAVAEACLENSAYVTISSSNPDRINAAVSRLQTSYPSHTDKIFSLKVDLSNPTTLEQELETLLRETTKAMKTEKLDHIVLTAGDALAPLPIAEITMEKVLKAGQIRFFAPLLLAKFLPRYLKSSYESSYTITTGSISQRPIPNWSVIASYAGGHESMVRNLALDLKPIRVNGVSPGVVDTELWTVEGEEREKLMETLARKTATGRVGRVEDVAESFLGLLRDWNATGSMVSTNGGGLFI